MECFVFQVVPKLSNSTHLLNYHRHPRYRCSYRRRLPRMSHPSPPNEATLLENLRSGQQTTQLLALIALPQLPSQNALNVLQSSDVLDSPNRQVRLSAVATLGKLGDVSQTSKLLSVLGDMGDDYSVRAAAANALGYLLLKVSGEPSGEQRQRFVDDAVKALLHAVEEDEEFIVRYTALVSLGNIGDRAALSLLIRVATNEASPPLEAAASIAAIGEVVLAKAVDEDLMEVVTRRAADREEFVRAAVARTLGRWRNVGDADGVLKRMKGDEEKYGQSVMVLAILGDVLEERE